MQKSTFICLRKHERCINPYTRNCKKHWAICGRISTKMKNKDRQKLRETMLMVVYGAKFWWRLEVIVFFFFARSKSPGFDELVHLPWEERCGNGKRSRAHSQSQTGSSQTHARAQERASHWWALEILGQEVVNRPLGNGTAEGSRRGGRGRKIEKSGQWEKERHGQEKMRSKHCL